MKKIQKFQQSQVPDASGRHTRRDDLHSDQTRFLFSDPYLCTELNNENVLEKNLFIVKALHTYCEFTEDHWSVVSRRRYDEKSAQRIVNIGWDFMDEKLLTIMNCFGCSSCLLYIVLMIISIHLCSQQ